MSVPNGYNWKSVPNDKKEHYFEEFKKHYTWNPAVGRQIHDVFMRQASKLFSDMISKFKTKKDKKGKPPSVPDDAWKTWFIYWSQPEVVAISDKASNNRMSKMDRCLLLDSHAQI